MLPLPLPSLLDFLLPPPSAFPRRPVGVFPLLRGSLVGMSDSDGSRPNLSGFVSVFLPPDSGLWTLALLPVVALLLFLAVDLRFLP